YPFEPPRCQFITRVYHPNIDDQGRICFNILKSKPKGEWNPAISIPTLLTSLIVLLGDPNPDDPLLMEIASEFKENRALFDQKAEFYTKTYAVQSIDDRDEHVQLQYDTVSSQNWKVQDAEPLPSGLTSNSLIKADIPTAIGNSTSVHIASIQPKISLSKSLSRASLKKPSLKSQKSNAESNFTATTTSGLESSEPSSTNVPETADALNNDFTIHHVKTGDQSDATHSTDGAWRTSLKIDDIKTTNLQDSSHPVLNDTIPVSPVPVLDKKREYEATRPEFSITTTQLSTTPPDSVKSKKVKTVKNDSTVVKSIAKGKVISNPTQDLHTHSPETLSQSQSSRSTKPSAIDQSSPLLPTKASLPKLHRERSRESALKVTPRHTYLKGTHKPLQPIDLLEEQSRYFSAENRNIIDGDIANRTITNDAASIESKGKLVEIEDALEKRKAKGKDKAPDENIENSSTPNSDVFESKFISQSSSSTIQTLEPYMNSKMVAPLTIAQKRNLMKKTRP
ncbi:Ubiquitin-conjugating enzyme E2 T, partial [Haplosporangium sp. Z 27]